MTSRSYCFTVNNPTYTPTELPAYGRYAILASETGEEGTPHLQGYIEFSRPLRLQSVQKWLKCKAHCESRRGTREQAREYCMKEDKEPIELGQWILSPGNRTDLTEFYADCCSLSSLNSIADKHPSAYIKYWKACQHVRTLVALDPPSIRSDLKVSLYFGSPGSGKTRAAYAEDSDLYATPIGKDLWWDGYSGQKTVLFDDFHGECRLVDLLRLLDIYPIQVPVKGSFVWLHATRIIITSNVKHDYWYDYVTRQDSLEALTRRIHEIKEFPYEAETEEESEESEDDGMGVQLPAALTQQLDLSCNEILNF